MMKSEIMKYIAGLYDRHLLRFEERDSLSFDYARELYDGTKESILDDWWLSLIFFYDRIFYQGRRDTVSSTFEQATVKTLDEFLGDDKECKLMELSRDRMLEWENYGFMKGKEPSEPYCHELKSALESKRTGKGRDREMVIDTMKFISTLEGFNILCFTIDRISSGEIKQHYKELIGLRQIGQKTGKLWLRDTITTYGLEDRLRQQDIELLIPVDTWVKQVSMKLGIAEKDTAPEKLSKRIVEVSNDAGVCPIRFGAGLWVLGSKSLELLLERLGWAD